MAVENLRAGQDFEELIDTYTIFITEKDFYGAGEPLYDIQRFNLTSGKPFEDGDYILYVNGEYRGESALGKLMHDFFCSNPDDMYYRIMADRTGYLKRTREGVETMCKAFEESRLDSAITASIDTYREFGLDDENIVKKIMERFGITLESAIRYVNEASLMMA